MNLGISWEEEVMVAEDDAVPEESSALSFTIEQVAAQMGLTKRTLRYYEELGLLSPAERTEGNYRRYTQDDIQRLERIKNYRDLLGFSLAEIRNILDAEDERYQIKVAYIQATEAAAKDTHLERLDAIIQRHLEIVEQKIAGLEQLRSTLQAKLDSHKRVHQELQQHRDFQEHT